MTTIESTTFQADGQTYPALVARPSGVSGPRPGVLMIHDITGARSDIERNLRIIADRGYIAFAPLLFEAHGRSKVRCIVSTMRSLAMERGPAFGAVEAARQRLAEHPDCTGAVAVTGFCMGGGFALLVADRDKYTAAAPFYGSVRSHSFAGPHLCPVVASFGKRDPFVLRGERRLTRALDRHGVAHDTKTYPGVGHSFANRIDDTLPIPIPLLQVTGLAYDDGAATDAWNRVFAFFDDHFAEAAS